MSRPSPRRSTRPTIEDVAAAAQVSVATVSRALRGLPNVAPSTRSTVERIANELGYRPDPAAARLATGRTRTIGIVVPLLNTWYVAQVVAGAEAVCTENGYDILVMGAPDRSARQSLFAANASLNRRADGLILVDVPLTDSEAASLEASGTQVITLGTRSDRFPSLGIDDVAVAEVAVDHLLALGHRRIAVIGGQVPDPLGFEVPGRRAEGYERALRRAGIEPDPALRVSGNFSILGGRDAMATLSGRADPPTAVFAMSDEMAFGALLYARQTGIDVPGELSVIGVDDHDVSIVMGLTTVRQDVAGLGAAAARELLARLEGRAARGGHTDLAISLVIRSSTALPPDPHRSEIPATP